MNYLVMKNEKRPHNVHTINFILHVQGLKGKVEKEMVECESKPVNNHEEKILEDVCMERVDL